MTFLKKVYYFLFYKFYRFWEYVSIPKLWSDAKATLSVIMLELFFLQSLNLYYLDYIDSNSKFGQRKDIMVIVLLSLIIPNYFIFLYKDRWKQIIQQSEKVPKMEKKIASVMVWTITLAIIFCFFILLFFGNPTQ